MAILQGFQRQISADRVPWRKVKASSFSSGGSVSSESQADPPGLIAAARRVSSQLKREPLRVGEHAPDANSFSILEQVQDKDAAELLQLTSQSLRGRRAIGAMVGMAVADATGAPLEFLPVGKVGPRLDPRSLKIYGEYNKFCLKPGQWTDDTSMALCLADSILVYGSYHGSDIRVRFWNWWNKGYNNAFRRDHSRSKSVGLGGNSRESLNEMQVYQNPPPRYHVEGGEDAGNGSLMRLAPVPIFFHTDTELAKRASAESSYTTHPGPIAADACAFLGFVIVCALTREPGMRGTAAEFLDTCVSDYVELHPDLPQTAETLMKFLRAAEPKGSTERCWNWRDPAGPYLQETIEARGTSYNGYPVSPGYFGSYCMDGLAIAFHSIYHTVSFVAAIARCVNFLGDADSTGAICGQIAGAFYGIDGIDKRFVKRLNQWDDGEIALRGALLYALGSELSEESKSRTRTALRQSINELKAADQRREKHAEEPREKDEERAKREDKPPVGAKLAAARNGLSEASANLTKELVGSSLPRETYLNESKTSSAPSTPMRVHRKHCSDVPPGSPELGSSQERSASGLSVIRSRMKLPKAKRAMKRRMSHSSASSAPGKLDERERFLELQGDTPADLADKEVGPRVGPSLSAELLADLDDDEFLRECSYQSADTDDDHVISLPSTSMHHSASNALFNMVKNTHDDASSALCDQPPSGTTRSSLFADALTDTSGSFIVELGAPYPQKSCIISLGEATPASLLHAPAPETCGRDIFQHHSPPSYQLPLEPPTSSMPSLLSMPSVRSSAKPAVDLRHHIAQL